MQCQWCFRCTTPHSSVNRLIVLMIPYRLNSLMIINLLTNWCVLVLLVTMLGAKKCDWSRFIWSGKEQKAATKPMVRQLHAKLAHIAFGALRNETERNAADDDSDVCLLSKDTEVAVNKRKVWKREKAVYLPHFFDGKANWVVYSSSPLFLSFSA